MQHFCWHCCWFSEHHRPLFVTPRINRPHRQRLRIAIELCLRQPRLNQIAKIMSVTQHAARATQQSTEPISAPATI
jgi:hypothetical protein